MNMVQQRDGKGQFTDDLKPDAELEAKWAKDEKRAEAAAKICELFKIQLRVVGVRKLPVGPCGEGGKWYFETWSAAVMLALMKGLSIGRTMSKKDYYSALRLIVQAEGLEDEFSDVAWERFGEGQPTA